MSRPIESTPLQIMREAIDEMEAEIDEQLQLYPPEERWRVRNALEYDYVQQFVARSYRVLVAQAPKPTPRNII
jgi:hypothetical protein